MFSGNLFIRLLASVAAVLSLAAPASAAAWRPATEQEWVISAVTTDLLELSRFAAGPSAWNPLSAGAVVVTSVPPAPGVRPGTRYAVQFPAPTPARELIIGSQLWDPTLYAALLVADTKLTAGAAASSPGDEKEMWSRLAGLAAREYVTENRRLSSYLTSHPTDPALHEQAAFLLAALALRENSGAFWDPRPALNRAVAHLAFSRLLRRAATPATDSGALAEVLIGLVVDTKADCARRLADLRSRASSRPEFSAWLRAAEMRNTRDYRLLADVAGSTPLERVECFRALCEAVDSGAAVQRLRDFKLEKVPDWSRIVLQFGLRVGDGHLFSTLGLPMELRELQEALPQATTPAALVAALNVRAGPAVRKDPQGKAEIAVLDPGLWAEFLQRHLLHVGVRTWDFQENTWGVPDQAAQFALGFRQMFGELWLFPLADLAIATGRSRGDGARKAKAPVELTAVQTLLKERPEKVSDAHFRLIQRSQGNAEDGSPGREWFQPPVPEGTAFSWFHRIQYHPEATRRAELERLYTLAPTAYELAAQLLRSRAGATPPRAEFDRLMAPFLGYHHRALRQLAGLRETPPEESIKIYEQLAKANRNELIGLANRYKTQGRKDEAIATYERAIAEMPDSVSVANNLDWLVDELWQRGEKARAEKAAEFAAKVYSYRGLETMARLQERFERWERAEEYLGKIAERYQDRAPLLAFYLRRAQADPKGAYAAKAQAETARVFPGGQRRVTLAEFSGPPKRGVLVGGSNPLTEKAGLRRGDIVVALDGYAVESFAQYSFVRRLKDGPLDLIVWQGQGYRSVQATPPNRMFNVDFPDWRAP